MTNERTLAEIQKLIEASPAFNERLLISGRPASEVLARQIQKAQAAKGKAG